MAPYVDQPLSYIPPLQQLQYPVWDPRMGMWVQYPLMLMQPFHLGWGAPQGLVFDGLKLSMHDRLGPSQSGQEKRVDQHPHQSDQFVESVRSVEQQAGLELMLWGNSAKGKEKVEQSILEGGDV
jgi:hypothetical protein